MCVLEGFRFLKMCLYIKDRVFLESCAFVYNRTLSKNTVSGSDISAVNLRDDEWSLRAVASMPSTAIFLRARAEIKKNCFASSEPFREYNSREVSTSYIFRLQ